jgi:Ca-activated chloride channel family protein
MLAVVAIVVALARPQSSSGGQNVTTEGIDIVMAIDISASMLAEDLKPNRIDAAKKVAQQFIDSRPNDRIGLVIFSGESFSQCPITSDHAVIKNLLGSIESGMLADGTAIGEGLATAVNRIKTSKSKSKVIILLTDGVNNVGAIDPLTAGDIAKAFQVRVYTIGAGTQGMAPYPFKTPFGIQYQNVPVQIDEEVLKQIADETGGKYFRATNTSRLKDIYAEIDQMEKTKISVTEFHNKTEEFYPLILIAVLFLFLESILKYTVLKSLP